MKPTHSRETMSGSERSSCSGIASFSPARYPKHVKILSRERKSGAAQEGKSGAAHTMTPTNSSSTDRLFSKNNSPPHAGILYQVQQIIQVQRIGCFLKTIHRHMLASCIRCSSCNSWPQTQLVSVVRITVGNERY